MEIDWQITQRRIVASVLAANAVPVKDKRMMLKHLRGQPDPHASLDVFFPGRGIFGSDMYMAQALGLGTTSETQDNRQDDNQAAERL